MPGSDRPPVSGITHVAAAPLAAGTIVDVTVVLRRRAEVPESALAVPIPGDEFARAYGADPRDVDVVTETLTELGLQVLEIDLPSRRIRVSGTVALLSRVFGTSLELLTTAGPHGDDVTFRHRTGGLSVPAPISGVVTAVLGLDNRPQARTSFRIAAPAAVASSYTPPELGTVYRFPSGTDGSGQNIAILELGGGYDQADLTTYFSRLGIPTPSVTAVGVDGAQNMPGQDPNGADGEVLLDIEVTGALAPGAGIVVYFAPNTDAGFLDALSAATHAAVTPAAISISWGQSEDEWTAQALAAFDQALIDACALGITVTVAAGDDGSTDRATDGRVHADFPASSPHALACGGTGSTPTPTPVRCARRWSGTTGQAAAPPAAESATCSRCRRGRPTPASRPRQVDPAAVCPTSPGTPTRKPGIRSGSTEPT